MASLIDLEVPTVEAEEEKPIPKPVPCGIGTCVPEEEPEEPEEIPEDKVFYKCNGCELGDKCYPMGYRKQGQYCSDNNEFIGQLGSGTCDNNFECKSNVCISSECVGEGLIKKILNWFKKLFGGEDEEPEPEPGDEICRELLIEENIGDYEYFTSEYGSKDAQIALYSEDGEQIDIVKCCVAGYSEPDGEPKGTAGLVCPFNNKKDIENSIYWLSNKGEIILGEYKGQEVYSAGNAIIWTHKDFIIASGTDPNAIVPFPEKIINAYLDKYPNDLGETQNAEECEEITDSDEKYKCYTSLAIKDKDISICERIIIRDEVYRQTDIYIKDKCYRDVAIETGNANACEKISGDDVDTEDSCYIEIALKTKDSSLCEKTIQKNLCYAIVTNNPNICERITTSKEKDACYYLVAIETNDNSLCGRINSTFGKDECYENIA